MTLKCIATSSEGNSFILTNDDGKHLLIEAGLPIPQIKKSLNYDIENLQALITSHSHSDHAMSVEKIRQMGVPVFLPYKLGKKHIRTMLDDFMVESFQVPHNGTDNYGFLIDIDEQRICYMCDLEYCPYDLSDKDINVLIIECNYISDLVDDDIPNLRHKCLGHLELETCLGIIKMCQKRLHKVILIHMSKGVTMDRERAMKRIREEIPFYVEVDFAKSGETYDLNKIPF